MIKVNGETINLDRFPDNTLLVKYDPCKNWYPNIDIEWHYEDDSELFAVYCLAKHLKNAGNDIYLSLPYVPNARQDRVKNSDDVFTLKYFSEIINSIGFKKIYVRDVHSSVAEALIDHIKCVSIDDYIETVIEKVTKTAKYKGENNNTSLLIFYPDEGAMKRYSEKINRPYAFGAKRRDWETGKITGLDVIGDTDTIKGSTVLIVDDICSKGGTFYHSAKKLKELGAKNIILYVTHCENTILKGDLLDSGLIDKVYTTNSIFTKEHEKIEVIEL